MAGACGHGSSDEIEALVSENSDMPSVGDTVNIGLLPMSTFKAALYLLVWPMLISFAIMALALCIGFGLLIWVIIWLIIITLYYISLRKYRKSTPNWVLIKD